MRSSTGRSGRRAVSGGDGVDIERHKQRVEELKNQAR